MKEIYQTLSQYGQFSNPAKVVGGAVLYGIAALLVTLILLIIFRKKILVSRSHKALRVLAYTYFILLPLLAGFFFMKWGFFNSMRKDIKAHTEVYIRHIPSTFDAQTSAAVKLFLQDQHISLATLSSDQLIDAVAEVIYAQYNTLLEKQASLKEGSNLLLSWALKISKGQGIARLMKNTIHKMLKEKLGLDESVSKELMASRIDEVLRTGFFAKITLIQVDHFLKGIQKGILITFFILLSIPLAEILIAHYLLRKKMATQAVAPQPVVTTV